MKANWSTKKIGEVCKIQKGKKPELFDIQTKSRLPYLGAKFMRGTKEALLAEINDKNSVPVSFEDLIIICDGSKSGEVFSGFIGILSSTMGRIDFDREQIEKTYFELFLKINFDLFNSSKKGAAIPHLDFTILNNIQIPLPPIGEQRKIVAKLEGVLGKIKEAKKLREEAESAVATLLLAELCKLFFEGKNNGWEEKRLGDVFIFNYGKGLSRAERSALGQYIVYGANGELGRSDRFLVDGDGIIVGRKGSAGALTRVSGKYWPTDVTYFVTENSQYDIGFSYYLFKFLNFQQYAVGVKPGINRNKIYSILIPLPALAEQKKIAANLDSLSEKIQKLQEYQESTAADLISLEESILSEAFKF